MIQGVRVPFFEQWFNKLDPSTAWLTAIVTAGLVAWYVFIRNSVWPWYIKEYFPTRVKRAEAEMAARTQSESDRNNLLLSIRDALVELRTIAQQQSMLLQQHDVESRQNQRGLADMQRTIVERLPETDPEAR